MPPSTNFEWPAYTKKIHRSVYPEIDPTNPANSASGKVVLITGGGIGVGKGIAQAFVSAGAKAVAILGRREHVLQEAKRDLELSGSSSILAFTTDVLDESALEQAFAATEKEVGPIDITVANAGYLASPALAIDADLDEYMKSFEFNIKSTILTFRCFHKHRNQNGSNDPTFICLSSAAGHAPVPHPGVSSYAASKTAQAQLISYLQAENEDVRVVQFHPGIIDTEMMRKSQVPFSTDNMSLPSSFAVWLSSRAASWTRGLYLWAHWDVEELEARKEEILRNGELKIGLVGWPRSVDAVVVP